MKKIWMVLSISLILALVGCTAADPWTDDFHTEADIYAENIAASGDISAGGDLDVTGDLTVDDIVADNISGNTLDVDHAYTHEWQGTDEINIYGLLGSIRPYLFTPFDGGFTYSYNGTGYGSIGKWGAILGTGATTGSVVGYVLPEWSFYFQTDDLGQQFGFASVQTTRLSSDQRTDWVGYFSDATTYPTNTSNHFGFKWISNVNGVDSDLYATNGNGVAYTETLLTTVSTWEKTYVIALYLTSEIAYYWSNDAVTWNRVSITTNRPNYTNLFYGYWIYTNEADGKETQYYAPRIFYAVGVEP